MEKQELINIINELPIGEDARKNLLDKIESGTSLQEIENELETLIKTEEDTLDSSNPEASAKYKAIMNDYSNEVEKAVEDFNNNISKIEDEIEAVGLEVSKQLDEVKIEELKS